MGHHRHVAGRVLDTAAGEVGASLPVVRPERRPSHGAAMLDRAGGEREHAGVVGLERQRLGDQTVELGVRALGTVEQLGARLQEDVVCCGAPRPLAAEAPELRRLDLRLDRGGDALGDAVLELEDVPGRPVEGLRPEMRAGHGVDQLGGDPQPLAGAPQAAPQHVPRAEFLRHLVGRPVAQREGRGRQHGDRPEAPERGDDVLRHAVGKIGVAGRPSQHLEGQHGEPRRLGARVCRSGPIVPHEPVPDPRHRHDPVPPIRPRPQRLA